MKDETAKSEIRIINKKAFPWAFTDFRRGHCKHGTCPTSDPMYPSALAPSRNLEPGHAGADPYPHPTHTGLAVQYGCGARAASPSASRALPAAVYRVEPSLTLGLEPRHRTSFSHGTVRGKSSLGGFT